MNGGSMNKYEYDYAESKPLENVCSKLENAPISKATLDLLPQLIWIQSRDISFCNHSLQLFLGRDSGLLHESEWFQYIHREDIAQFQHHWNDRQHLNPSFELNCRICNAQGEYYWFKVQAVHQYQQNLPFWIISCTNIDAQMRKLYETTEALKANRDMLDASLDCIKIITPDGELSHMNKAGCQALLGKPDVQQFGMSWVQLLAPEVQKSAQSAIHKAAKGKNNRFLGKTCLNGKLQYWDNLLTPVLNEAGQTSKILCVSRDITRQRIAEIKLKYYSEYDELTGLINRRAFKIKLKQSIEDANVQQSKVGMMFIDLDHFKNVNDTLGHPAGDYLLKVIAKRLLNSLPDKCHISRLGGDEFAIIIPRMHDAEEVYEAAQRALKLSRSLVKYQGKVINSGMSIGCAVFPDDAHDVYGLMKCADNALNDLKEKGRGSYRMYDKDMYDLAKAKMQQLDTARYILRENLIEPFYQPKVRLNDLKVVGFEALLRWHDHERRLHLPSTIVEAFNNYDLASRISEVMHDRIFSDMAGWIQQGLTLFPISINASPVEFMRDSYAETLIERLEHYHIPPELIEVEITEHLLVERGSAFVIRALQKLKAYGLRISLDDFGTGHSSMTHLRDYPVDCLKIDYAFVNQMNNVHSIGSIVEGITKLGPILSLDVIAEGVENDQQLSRLQQIGCVYGQGFLFSQAMNHQDTEQLLRQGKLLPAVEAV